ncbi:MAG: hypothetical protein LBO78_00810 [Rickettsiales bacterium]|jgi:hypothetical protein|nr:hypothetical protein [Rickettsiales bacterium]
MAKVFCTVTNSFIGRLSAGVLSAVEKHIIDSGLGSDKDSFEVIKERLVNPPVMTADEFAFEAIYVILAGGFRQAVAKRKFHEIAGYIESGGEVTPENLLKIFGNLNKVRAIAKIWNGRHAYRDRFYAIPDDGLKIEYLGRLPHIGEITKSHLARNLGITNVKYDVWIQRLGIALCGGSGMSEGFPLRPEVRDACDRMFSALERETGLNRGYLDVILWKACQTGMFKFE